MVGCKSHNWRHWKLLFNLNSGYEARRSKPALPAEKRSALSDSSCCKDLSCHVDFSVQHPGHGPTDGALLLVGLRSLDGLIIIFGQSLSYRPCESAQLLLEKELLPSSCQSSMVRHMSICHQCQHLPMLNRDGTESSLGHMVRP